jgi:hypothetical protein
MNKHSVLLMTLVKPAHKALAHSGIKTIKQPAKYSGKEILALYGIGKTAMPKMKKALKKTG